MYLKLSPANLVELRKTTRVETPAEQWKHRTSYVFVQLDGLIHNTRTSCGVQLLTPSFAPETKHLKLKPTYQDKS